MKKKTYSTPRVDETVIRPAAALLIVSGSGVPKPPTGTDIIYDGPGGLPFEPGEIIA